MKGRDRRDRDQLVPVRSDDIINSSGGGGDGKERCEVIKLE